MLLEPSRLRWIVSIFTFTLLFVCLPKRGNGDPSLIFSLCHVRSRVCIEWTSSFLAI